MEDSNAMIDHFEQDSNGLSIGSSISNYKNENKNIILNE